MDVVLGGASVIHDVTFAVAPGEWLSVVGPNGAGKSTLLRACAGLVGASGDIELDGTPLSTLGARARAQRVALVPQVPVVPAGVTVVEYVLLGRTPHIPFLGSEDDDDLDAVHAALALLDLVAFAARDVDSLSGGERQRVLLARALAQDTPLLLLDEPTTALDIGHQQDVLDLVEHLRHTRALTVVSTMHDLTLAGQYADRLVLLDRGRLVDEGPAAHVLTEANVARHYGARVRVLHDEHGGLVVIPARSAHSRGSAPDPEAAP
ncbi:MAG TPA: ABC transporter ATP-binding protein [Acidimicrobiia bacterium]|nr:ABC transporter ATP-binding protein [Acidimicrobiia bacterium]